MKRLIIPALFALSACASDNPAAQIQHMNLAGSEWGSASLGDAFVQFGSEGKVTGHGGCNRFFGQFTQTENTVSIGPMASTKMMCPPAQMKTERALLGALESAVTIDATHLVLILKDKNGTALLELQRRDWD